MFRKPARRSRARQVSEGRFSQFEKLEKREVFAGNVIVGTNPATHSIRLTGDMADNAVEVRSVGASTLISGLAGTTINGAASFVVPFFTPSLQSELGGGDDHIFIHDLTLSSLDVKDLVGNNSVVTSQLQVYNNVKIATDYGADSIDFQGQVQGDVAISTGRCDDTVTFEGEVGVFLSPLGAPTVSPLVDIATGLGNDSITVENSHLFPGAMLTVNSGGGDDVFDSVNNTIDGTLRLRMEAGRDQAFIVATDSLFADYGMGDGNDILDVDMPSLVGTASIFDGGNGFDILNRHGLLIGAPVNFEVLI